MTRGTGSFALGPSVDTEVERTEQIESITQALFAMSAFDFSVDIPIRYSRDAIDSLAQAARVLQRELSASAVSAGHMQSLLESMPNPVALLDIDGRIIEANSTMLQLLAPGGIGELTDDFVGWLNACLSGSVPLELARWSEPVQVPCTLSDVEYHYLFSVAPMKSHFDDTDGYVAVGTDISNQVRVERQLKQAKELAEGNAKARSSFLANMSHEIRTPLHGIIGSTELLLAALGAAGQDEVEAHARVIQSCGQHLLALINDILDFSRIDSKKITLESSVFDLVALLRGCLSSVESSYRKDGVEARVSLPEALPCYVKGDPMRLRQIVFNLLGNAFKFTERGRVELHVEMIDRNSDQVLLRVEVRDTGIGISPQKIGDMFAPFEQVDVSVTRRFGGTGLGLAIAKQLVELMGGRIGAESTPGKGSTFWFTLGLPLAEAGSVEDILYASSTSAVEVPVDLDGVRVLLVEDNVVSQRIAAMMLRQMGCEVTVADHGGEALERLAESQFDIIFMDCQMPIMDGLSATRELRRRERERRTPVIALTADAFDAHRKSCLEAGMDGYLRKPVGKANLCRAIAEYLR